jgi:hypothetical protein
MTAEKNECYAELIRSLVSCQQQATRLGLPFLGQLIGMAVMEAALQWDGGVPLPADPSLQIERLLRLKVRIALAYSGGNILSFDSKTVRKDADA